MASCWIHRSSSGLDERSYSTTPSPVNKERRRWRDRRRWRGSDLSELTRPNEACWAAIRASGLSGVAPEKGAARLVGRAARRRGVGWIGLDGPHIQRQTASCVTPPEYIRRVVRQARRLWPFFIVGVIAAAPIAYCGSSFRLAE